MEATSQSFTMPNDRSRLRLRGGVQSEESSGDEGDNLWDPQHATPWRPRIRRRSGGHPARPSASQAQLQVRAPCAHTSWTACQRLNPPHLASQR